MSGGANIYPGAADAALLLNGQINDWQLCGNNYRQLQEVQTRSFTIKGNTVRVQYNPARITSTSAKVDAKSIAERKCFLCRENRPPEQQDLMYGTDYLILVNPFPILPEHFTIPHAEHLPQEIKQSFGAMLRIGKSLSEKYFIFYNGPKCGASAPDHLHFQAGNLGFLPLETELEEHLKTAHRLKGNGTCSGYFVNDGLRKYTVLRGAVEEDLIASFNTVYTSICTIEQRTDEPLMNVLCYFTGSEWTVVILHRSKHRPAMYFAEGEAQMMLSPATIDISGVAVTPREEDFNKITPAMLETIFAEVFPDEEWEKKYKLIDN